MNILCMLSVWQNLNCIYYLTGGGLGGTRRGGPDVNVRHSGREDREGGRDRDDRSNSRRRSKSRDRDRSRERRRRRSRSKDRKRTRRSKSRSRDRKRSKSRDRKKRRSRSPRAERRRDRERGAERKTENGNPWDPDVKEEPKEEVDYDEYSEYPVKQEQEDRKPMRIVEDNGGYEDEEY
jgi:U1 small nuclear ribonucleoprotein